MNFKILNFTMNTGSGKKVSDNLSCLYNEILKDCFQNYPDIGLEDIISENVSFIAKKEN